MKGYIRRRGRNSHRIAVYVGDDKRGYPQYYYETVRGSRGKAENRVAEIISEINAKRFVMPTRVTLAEYLTRWLQDYARVRVRPTTYDLYETLIRVHIIPELGKVQLDRLKPQAIQSFYARKLTGPRADGKPGTLTPSTVKHMHTVLRVALRHAVKWQLITRSPLDSVDPPKVEKKEIRVWDLTQVASFLQACQTHRLYAAFLLVLATGMRRGELLGLRWTDINFPNRVLKVSQELVVVRRKLSMQQPKTAGSRRPISIPEEVLEALREHGRRQAEEKEAFEEAYVDNGLVFCQEDGRPLDPRAFTRTFENLTRRAELPRISFHALRHTHATMLLQAGVNVKAISERLGHAEISTTLDIYSHVLPPQQQEAARITGNLLFGKTDRTVH